MRSYGVLLAALLLTSCQTMTEQNALTKTANEKPNDSQQSELSPKSVVAQKNILKPVDIQQADTKEPDKVVSEPKADFSQSRPPMSEATRQRLKAHAQELINNGSMPTINYQQPQTPGLQIGGSETAADKASKLIQLNYEQVEVRQILEEFADALNISIVIDPSITGVVTMRTAPNSTLSQKDLWPLLQMILGEAGIALEKRNNVYHAKRDPTPLPSTMGTATILDTTDAFLVMQVTPLKHISLDAALTVLKPIAGPKGRIVPIAALNTLLIIEKPEQLKRINGLLSLIDADPFKHRGIHLYKIKEAEAIKVAKELQDILKLIEGDKPAYQVMGLERVNALLVVAPPGRGFKEVSRWVDILDAGADEELVEQIFVYKCKSLKASSLAATLNAIFEQEDKSVKKEKPEEVDNPNEFKTVSKESLSFEAAVKRETDKKKKAAETPKPGDNKSKPSTTDEVASANINVTIVADEDTNSLLIRTTARDYKQLLQTIRTLDTVPLQVLVDVVIASVLLNDKEEFGISWKKFITKTLDPTGNALEFIKDGGVTIAHRSNDWQAIITAFANEADTNILSRPSLLITNNQEGIINVGEEVPVKVGDTQNTGSDTLVTNQIAYRKTGIELTVTPTINDDGIVDMKIDQGLSSVEDESGEFGPTFSNQEITTNVVIKDGETIILGGLISSKEVEAEDGIPVLKDVPIMGNLFKNQVSDTSRRELVLIISTKIVDVNGGYDYDGFNNAFKNRYYAAARYLDEQLDEDNLQEWKRARK